MKKEAEYYSFYAKWMGLVCFCLIALYDHSAVAASMADGMCTAIKFMTGPVGKAIATAGIIVIAVGALLGRVSWGMAVMIAAGIAGIFGAPAIAGAIAKASSATAGDTGYCE